MRLTDRETWAILHGMVFGALFLLAFTGGFAGLWSLRPGLLTEEGVRDRTRRLTLGTRAMAGIAWAAVLTGTWMIYPWYREPGGIQAQLLASASTSGWETIGMAWKEHIAWFAPILSTGAAIVVGHYREALVDHRAVRLALLALMATAFACAATAGLFGALITRVAPVR